jgi:hypothetical protein
MFDGNIKGNRVVSLGGRKTKTDAKDLMKEAQRQREARAAERHKNASAVKIQRNILSKVSRVRLLRSYRLIFDHHFQQVVSSGMRSQPHSYQLVEVSSLIQELLLSFARKKEDVFRVISLVNFIKDWLIDETRLHIVDLFYVRPASPRDNLILTRLTQLGKFLLSLIVPIEHVHVEEEGNNAILQLLESLLADNHSAAPALCSVVLSSLLVESTTNALRNVSRLSAAGTLSSQATQVAFLSEVKSLLVRCIKQAVSWENAEAQINALPAAQRQVFLEHRSVRYCTRFCTRNTYYGIYSSLPVFSRVYVCSLFISGRDVLCVEEFVDTTK